MTSWAMGDHVEGAPDFVRRPHWDFHVEWLDLYPFVSEHYGRSWLGEGGSQNTYQTEDVVGHPDGTENNSAAEIEDMFKRWYDHAFRDTIASGWDLEIWDQENAPPQDAILWDLCRKGVIPAGKYLITMWW